MLLMQFEVPSTLVRGVLCVFALTIGPCAGMPLHTTLFRPTRPELIVNDLDTVIFQAGLQKAASAASPELYRQFSRYVPVVTHQSFKQQAESIRRVKQSVQFPNSVPPAPARQHGAGHPQFRSRRSSGKDQQVSMDGQT